MTLTEHDEQPKSVSQSVSHPVCSKPDPEPDPTPPPFSPHITAPSTADQTPRSQRLPQNISTPPHHWNRTTTSINHHRTAGYSPQCPPTMTAARTTARPSRPPVCLQSHGNTTARHSLSPHPRTEISY